MLSARLSADRQRRVKERQVTKRLEQKRHENRRFNMFHSLAYRQNERKRHGKGLKSAQSNIPTEKIVKKGLCIYSLRKVVVKLQCKEQCMTKKTFFRTTLQLFLIIIFINRRQQLLTEAHLFSFFRNHQWKRKISKERRLSCIWHDFRACLWRESNRGIKTCLSSFYFELILSRSPSNLMGSWLKPFFSVFALKK